MPSRVRQFVLLLLAGLLVSALAPVPSFAAPIKLYMKNGSYQLVSQYEVKGDRVRYYSVERSEWEEIPLALVDFDATKRAQQEEQTEHQKELERAHELETERFERSPAAGFEISPGVRLPQDSGVFAFDGRQVVRLVQSPAEIVRDKKRFALQMVLPGPLLKNQQLVVLAGPRAAIRLGSLQPAFYIQMTDTSGHFVLMPVKSSHDARVVERIQAGVGVGKSGELRDAVPLESKQLAAGVWKITPEHPLAVGEYVLGELVSDKLNLDVWDFGVEGAPTQTQGADEKPPVIRRNPTSN